MSKKDFELIAQVLSDTKPSVGGGARDQWDWVVVDFAGMLTNTNPNFDRDRFYAACGYEP